MWGEIRISEVISALSYALDLTEGQPMGHSVRGCVIGMHLARQIGLPVEMQTDLYYALLMKDAGCSSNASRMYQILGDDDIRGKRDVKTTDWTKAGWESLQYALSHVRPQAPFLERVRAIAEAGLNRKRNARDLVQLRCERGSAIARGIGLSDRAARAIHSLDELWNGRGHPEGLKGTAIPLLSRIMNVAQTAEVFYTHRGPAAALAVVNERKGKWFDPDLCKAFESVTVLDNFWLDLDDAAARVIEMEPTAQPLRADDGTLDRICTAFADVIDAKSPFTYRHSVGVAAAAAAIGTSLALDPQSLTSLRRAALLHDIGKLGVSNSILDKPAKLTDGEWQVVRQHPSYSHKILRRISGFSTISEMAASHHEKLDGSGYFRQMTAADLSLPARILAVADIYDALAAKRPYRDALPVEEVFAIMEKDAPHALDADCVEALKRSALNTELFTLDLARLSSEIHGAAPIDLTDTTDKNTGCGLVKPLAGKVH